MSEWGDKLLTEADNARLRAENAKLRELFAEVWPIAEYAGRLAGFHRPTAV